jgi:uncharacterized membrane protein YphA (DoxX/SURF4 family)
MSLLLVSLKGYNKLMSNIIKLYIIHFLQIAIAATLINVWIVHFYKPTKYRGNGSKNMSDEFTAYGLPQWSMYIVGASKILIAFLLILGFWFPFVILPALGIGNAYGGSCDDAPEDKRLSY